MKKSLIIGTLLLAMASSGTGILRKRESGYCAKDHKQRCTCI